MYRSFIESLGWKVLEEITHDWCDDIVYVAAKDGRPIEIWIQNQGVHVDGRFYQYEEPFEDLIKKALETSL